MTDGRLSFGMRDKRHAKRGWLPFAWLVTAGTLGACAGKGVKPAATSPPGAAETPVSGETSAENAPLAVANAPPALAPSPGVRRASAPVFERVPWAGTGTLSAVRAIAPGRAVAVGEPGVVWIGPEGPRVAPFPEGHARAVWAARLPATAADEPAERPRGLAVGDRGLAWMLDDVEWRRIPTGTEVDLFVVDAVHGPDGRFEAFAAGEGVFLQLERTAPADGGAEVLWRFVPAEIPEGVSVRGFAIADGRLVAVGDRIGSAPGEGVVLVRNGSGWIDACPELACGGAIRAAWSPGGDELWTAGPGEIVRYGNGRAELFPVSRRTAFRALAGSGAGDVFAAGEGGLVLHHDGQAWTPLESPGVTIHAMDALPSGEVWAVGEGGAILHLPPPPTG